MEIEYDLGKENRKILYIYLKKHYGQVKAEELMIKNNNNLFGYHGLAWVLGERDFDFFCEYFLQDTFTPKPTNAARNLAPIHFEVWDNIKRMFQNDEFDNLELILPRGTAKTTVVNFAVSVWLHSYSKSIYTLVCGKTEQDSIEFMAQTKQAFEENKYIIQAFGALIDNKNCTVNKLELELSNKTKVQAISSTSSVRGKKFNGSRPSVIIADDYQGKSDVITQEARDKKYNTWIEDAGYAGDEAVIRNGVKVKQATKFIVLGTILHRDCFMSRLLNNKDYNHILKRVVEFDVDEYLNDGLWGEFRTIYFNNKLKDSASEAKEFYYQNEEAMKYNTIWNDKFDCLKLAIRYFNNSRGFKQEMMNDASKIGEKWFKSNRAEINIENHKFIKTMLCVDPASTSKKTSDSFAFLVGSLADNDFKYVRKAELLKIDARTEFDKYINHMIELLKKYTDINTIYIEKNTFNGSDANILEKSIKADNLLRGKKFTIINEAQKLNKDDKIATIVADVNNGRIIFNEEDIDFTDELMDFCGQDFSAHDDAPDIVSEFANRIKDVKSTGQFKMTWV
ncbi:hypothetical protein [Clostridium sp. FP1]|uniref:hypothetical protein n=1 Tax=Clostridium sp. FP1 TaxID=2724076 RepID=UPI0013E98360|nr:hypothetical protein [Clostridium sp. FP1]MBZ9635598.1 hypothetical protein [Clostridium sp. FP1]